MGLFDQYDPATSQDGSLIANILAQYAAAPPDTSAPLSPIEQQMMHMTGPNQPVSGLGPAFAAQSPMDAQASVPAPQPQNDPIQYGNVSVPRIGSGFALPDGELDPETGDHVAPAPQHRSGRGT